MLRDKITNYMALSGKNKLTGLQFASI